jgi:hypothetical protein
VPFACDLAGGRPADLTFARSHTLAKSFDLLHPISFKLRYSTVKQSEPQQINTTEIQPNAPK